MKKISILLFLAGILIAPPTFSATKTWIGADGDLWGDAAKWNPAGIPGTLDDVVIDGFSGTIVINVNVQINTFNVINGSNVAFTSTATRNFVIATGATAFSSISSNSTLTVGDNLGSINFVTEQVNGADLNIDGSLIFTGSGSGGNNRLSCDGGTIIVNGILRYTGGGNTTVGFSLFSPAMLKFSANSLFEMAKNGGSVPNATYDAASLVKITGTTTTGPSFSSTPVYGNIEWNAPGQTAASIVNINLTCNNFDLVNTGGQSINLSSGGTNYVLKVNGNFTSLANTVLDLSSNFASNPVLRVLGSINIGGTVTEGGSGGATIELNGSGNQDISVSGSITNNVDFKMNNPAGATLQTALSLPDVLDLSSGNIATGTFDLTLNNSAPGSIINNSASSYVVTDGAGALIRSIAGATNTYDFPVGTSSNYNLATVSFTAAPAAGTLSARFIAADPGSGGLPYTDAGANGILNSVCPQGYWRIDGGVGGTYDLDLTSTGFACITAIADARILRRTTGAATWNDPNSAGNGTHVIGSGDIARRDGFAGFSEFGLAQGVDALPVELVRFGAHASGPTNTIGWVTALEKNLEMFEIERSNDVQNGKTWLSIGQMEPGRKASSSANSGQSYRFEDLRPAPVSYYRLKIKNTDGSFDYSDIVSVLRQKGRLAITSFYPVPASNVLNMTFSASENDTVQLQLIDIGGKTVYTQILKEASDSNTIQIDLRNLTPGVYYLRLDDGRETVVEKIAK
jgi:Secretion system C-terminal sorting domain